MPTNLNTTYWLTCNRINAGCLLHDYFAGLAVNATPPKEIIAAGIHTKNKYGDTPLHHAAQHGLERIPTALLTTENLSIENNDGTTPLHDAAQSGELMLIPKAAITETALMTKNTLEETPLFYAKENGNLDILLGIKFSPSIIPEVGQDWFDKNEAVIRAREQLSDHEREGTGIEIF